MDPVTYSTLALADLLDAFASTDPVPGGGSAAALAGALATSLLLMVSGMPKTRSGAPEEVADLSEAAARLRPLRDALIQLVDRDSEAYQGVLAAFKLPKGTADEKRTRGEAIEIATTEATEIPLETMRHCQQALRGARVVAARGNTNAASDVGVAIELLLAGLKGARLNVDINLTGLTDAAYSGRIRAECDLLERDATTDAHHAREALGLA